MPEVSPGKTSLDSTQNGATLYEKKCLVCHGPQGKGTTGPSLQSIHDANQVTQMIRVGKGNMPSFAQQLSPKEIQAIAAYVTQKLAVATPSLHGGDVSEGGVLYRANCAACHQVAARGGALVFASGNAPSLFGQGADAIAGAIRSGPGEMPTFPPSVFNDHQVASIVKYVQFVRDPPAPGGLPLNYFGPVAEGLIALIAVVLLAVIGRWIEGKGRG
jgi:ubiquinol-cytochrome c reductase cytochrome c subunit